MSDISVEVGPGYWHIIHSCAMEYDKAENNQQDDYCQLIDILLAHFPCDQCRSHAIEYRNNHDLMRYCRKESSIQYPLSTWGWLFHNAVNQRLKKPYLSWKEFEQRSDIGNPKMVPGTWDLIYQLTRSCDLGTISRKQYQRWLHTIVRHFPCQRTRILWEKYLPASEWTSQLPNGQMMHLFQFHNQVKPISWQTIQDRYITKKDAGCTLCGS